ncbi:unnamed protein product, partial [Ceratitis capitata]
MNEVQLKRSLSTSQILGRRLGFYNRKSKTVNSLNSNGERTIAGTGDPHNKWTL